MNSVALATSQTKSALTTTGPSMTLIDHALKRLEARLLEVVSDTLPFLVEQFSALIQAGGKRIRPRMTFHTAQLFEANPDRALTVAAGIELLHTATLVHDDLVDHATERRGVQTLNSGMPTELVVLSGDLLFAKAAALIAEAEHIGVVKSFARALTEICTGELLQAQTKHTLVSLESYYERIYGKTASLFRTAAESGAMIGRAAPAQIATLGEYGRLLGMAFQIVDDALDFNSDAEQLGKPSGHDLREGILSLPVLLYHDRIKGEVNGTFRRVLAGKGSEAQITALVNDIRASGVVEEALDIARDFARQAREALSNAPDGPAKDGLIEMTQFAVARDY